MDGEQNNVNMGGNPNSGMGSAGPIIAVIVILAIIVLAGLYFWGQRMNGENMMYGDNVETQSQSDDPNSIEADLNSTNVDNVDAEVNAS